MSEGNGTMAWRVAELERVRDELIQAVDRVEVAATRHEEQIYGEGGLRRSIDALTRAVEDARREFAGALSETRRELNEDVKSLQRVLVGAAVTIAVSAIGSAVTVALTLSGGGG